MLISVFLALHAAAWPAHALAQPASVVAAHDCRRLDYGIYWYGEHNQAQKAEAGVANRYWRSDRPTVIYVPGWQPNVYASGEHEDFSFAEPPGVETLQLADAWLQAGWNVGAFYWEGLADEDDARDAEAKIWQADSLVGMRWRTCSGDFSWDDMPTHSVGELFYRSYRQAMQGYQGSDIRLVGHSLGAQLATRGAALISAHLDAGELPPNLLPTRLALLDPWWTAPYLTKVWPLAVPQLNATARDLLRRGVLLEMYQSSDLLASGFGDQNEELTALIGQCRWVPEFITDPIGMRIGDRHAVAPKLYFLSFAAPPPRACVEACSDTALSAAASNSALKQHLASPKRWVQSCGQMTASSADDCFIRE